jgi:AmmeMemoRadiSam system protein A
MMLGMKSFHGNERMESITHPYVTLAIHSVRHFLEQGVHLPCPENLTEDLLHPKGAFVSIKNGMKLRGCIGELTPTHDNLAIEIIQNAVSAASRDPRFPPISKDEIADLIFSVDVLTPLEKVDDVSQLDCKKFGLTVTLGDKQGVLLPDLEGVDSVAEQLRICLKKGGIDACESYEMHRFEVERFC